MIVGGLHSYWGLKLERIVPTYLPTYLQRSEASCLRMNVSQLILIAFIRAEMEVGWMWQCGIVFPVKLMNQVCLSRFVST